jgi:DNA-binding winged helix-turn-helix (wHTH) protein
MANIRKRFYEFGSFRIDPEERLLWKEGQAVALPPKVFATLLVLVEKAPQVVEKDELLKTVWPDTFVEESNLSQNVFSLRKVLGAPECIENIPKRGYRFRSAVRSVEEGSRETALARRSLRRVRLAAGAAVLVALTGGALYLRFGHPRSQVPSSARPAAPVAVSAEAYDLYLRARYHLDRKNRKDNDEAIALLEKSTSIDPLFAPAQAQLALAYGVKSFFFNATEPQWEDKGFAAIQKAEALNIDLPEIHFGRSSLLWRHSHAFPHREALVEARKAYSIQPNFDEAWHLHAVILFHVGHIQEAWREIEKTLSINPANDQARYRFGPMLNYQRKWQEAIDALNHVPREVTPGLWSYQMAWALQSLNRLPEASRLLEAALAEDTSDPGGNLYGARAMVRAKSGDRHGAESDVARAIRVGKGFGHFHHTAYSLAAVYSVLGDLDKAQEWIENASNDGFPCYTLFEADPNLQRLRATPRFQAFVAKLRREYEHIPGETESGSNLPH